MKKSVLISVLLLSFAATAASRTATEAYVTNRVTQATNALHEAIAPTIDYSTNNTTLVATIEATSPRQEIPEEISTLTNVLFQVSPPEYLHYGWHFAGTAEAAGYASFLYTGQSGQTIQNRMFDGAPRWAAYTYLDTLLGVFAYQSEITTAMNAMIAYTDAAALAATNYTDSATQDLASTSYVDRAIANIPEGVTPATVTNIVRELSLGGIWDARLEVWWTPVMSNGALTYQATTNVNLNAEN